MTLRELFGGKEEEPTTPEEIQDEISGTEKRWVGKEIDGKIIKLGSGWGFISSTNIPYTRIFFHWTNLVQDTLKFPELRKNMKVSFILTYKEGRDYSAVRVRVDESELEPIDK